MVAVLLRLRFQILSNTLRRNPIQLIAVVLGAVFASLILVMFLGVMLFVSTAPPEATQLAVVVSGSALVLGWCIVPLVFDGIEQTLDSVKLARYPLRTGQLMSAMFLVGITWVPGIVTIAASVGTAIAWRMYPASAALAIVAGLVGAATCVVGSRLSASIARTVLRGRGPRRFGIAALVLLVVAAPLVIATLARAREAGSDLLSTATSVIDALGWTPLGAVWSVPGRIALNDAQGAVAATLIAVATLAALVLLWRVTLVSSLNSTGDSAARTMPSGRLGILGWMPTTPIGAVAGRALIYWFRDTRLAKQLVLIPVLPTLMLISWSLFHVDAIAISAGPFVASLLPLSAFAGLSYDGSAFAIEIAAGVRGTHDRLGRAIALLAIAVPSVVIVQVAVAVIIGRVGDLPALLGLSLGTLLVSVGVISVSSARVVLPVAPSGRNPFSAQPGSGTTAIVASYAVSGITGLLALPVIAIAVVALSTGVAALGWIALVVSLALGTGLALLGVRLGGRILDRSAPAVLAQLRLYRV